MAANGSTPKKKGVIMLTTELVRTKVRYGLCGTAEATLSRRDVEGRSVREVVRQVCATPQTTESARRTSEMLVEIATTGRPVNVEIAREDNQAGGEGAMSGIDEPIAVGRDPERTPQELVIDLSEDYVGGCDHS